MDPVQQVQQQLANAFRQFAAANIPLHQQQQISALPNFEQFSASQTESGKFSRWFSRFKHFLDLHCADWEDKRKISLLMTKLDGEAYEEFESSLLPGKVADIVDFHVCVAKLAELFDAKRTLFMDRYKTMQLQIEEGEDMRTLANRVKRLVADFDFANFTEDNFKSLLFLLALKPKKYAKARTLLLQTLQSDPNRKFDDLVAYLSAMDLVGNEEEEAMTKKQQQKQTQNQQQQKQQQQQQQQIGGKKQKQQPQPPVSIVINQQQQQRAAAVNAGGRPTGPPPVNYVCTYCSGSGHWKWYCPKRGQAPPPMTYICNHCNEKGQQWNWQCPKAAGSSHSQSQMGGGQQQQMMANLPAATANVKKPKVKKENKN